MKCHFIGILDHLSATHTARFNFSVTVSAFVTQDGKKQIVDLKHRIKIHVEVVTTDLPKKDLVILLDRLTQNEIDAACNPHKNTLGMYEIFISSNF